MAEIDLDNIHWTVDGNGDYMPLIPAAPYNYPDEAAVLQGIVFGYADQYLGTLDASAQVPVPTVSAVDSQNGRQAVVTVSDALVGSTNDVYITWWGQNGVQEWQLAGSVTGDGTLTVSRPIGLYGVRVQSSKTGYVSTYALGNLFYITDSTSLCRVRIRDAVANSTMQVCYKLGFQADYQSPGRSAFKIWVVPETTENNLSMLGSEIGSSFSFLAPRQADFPPSDGFVPGARVGVNGVWYAVEVSYPTESPNYAPTFSLRLNRLDSISVEIDGTDV